MGLGGTVAASRPRRRAVLVLSAVAVLGLAAGCADGASAASGGTPSPGTASTSAASGKTALQVPLTTTVADGVPRVVVQISVGGGPLIPVVLDSGSTGLLVKQSALGSAVDRAGATTVTQSYLAGSVTGSVVKAGVTIGGATTTPIPVMAIDDNTSAAALESVTSGEMGIMGIAAGTEGGQAGVLEAPQFSLPAPYDQASTLDIASSGAGTWTLGPVTAAARAVSVPLTAVPGAQTAEGRWAKDVTLCWTVDGSASTCGATDLDSGAPSALVNETVAGGSKTGKLDAGLPITVSTPTGQLLWSYTTSKTPAGGETKVAALGSSTQFNTGLAFLYGHIASFDWSAGTLTLTTKS